jgi:hypothetical protein
MREKTTVHNEKKEHHQKKRAVHRTRHQGEENGWSEKRQWLIGCGWQQVSSLTTPCNSCLKPLPQPMMGILPLSSRVPQRGLSVQSGKWAIKLLCRSPLQRFRMHNHSKNESWSQSRYDVPRDKQPRKSRIFLDLPTEEAYNRHNGTWVAALLPG